MATKQDLAYQVSLTLGDHAGDYDVASIVEEIASTYGLDIPDIDAVPGVEYWAIVERHEKSQQK
jgi:hypothetical protein